MEWIKIILPLIGVGLGWLLSESGKIFADKRVDKRKLKKLLFFLLELRFLFTNELSKELNLDNFITRLGDKFVSKFGISKDDPEFNLEYGAIRPVIKSLLSKMKNQDEKFEYLADNIDKILIELAEIFPIMAYELNGQHNIKERLNNMEDLLNEAQSMTDEMPFDIKKWINPKLTADLLENLDYSIKKIAKKIDKQTYRNTSEKLKDMVFEEEGVETEKLLNEYFDKIIENLPHDFNRNANY